MFIPFISKSALTIIVQNEAIQDSGTMSCQFSTWCLTHPPDYEPLNPHCGPESVSSLLELAPLTGAVTRAGSRAEVQSQPCWGRRGLFSWQKVFLCVTEGCTGRHGCFNVKNSKEIGEVSPQRLVVQQINSSDDSCLSFIFSLLCFLSFHFFNATSRQHQRGEISRWG